MKTTEERIEELRRLIGEWSRVPGRGTNLLVLKGTKIFKEKSDSGTDYTLFRCVWWYSSKLPLLPQLKHGWVELAPNVCVWVSELIFDKYGVYATEEDVYLLIEKSTRKKVDKIKILSEEEFERAYRRLI